MTDIDGRKLNKQAQEERRVLAVKAVSQKLMSQAEAARFFEVSDTAVSDWMKKYRHGGINRLIGDKRGTGKTKSILSTHQVKAIQKIIETKTPDQLKLPFLLWSLEALQELIKQRY
jgi:transposase